MQNNKSKQKQAEKETPTNWQRIEMVIQQSKMTANAFARHIGLPRGENLYQIKKGNNGISLDVATRICQHYPEIDKLWLLTGDGQMLRDDAPAFAAALILPELVNKPECRDPYTMAVEHAKKLMAALAKKGGEQ